jgi:hypothetical protein
MRPSKPCPHCGTTKYGIIKNAWFELLSDAKRGFGNVLAPSFSVCGCTGCGATTLFDVGGKKGLLDACAHDVVDVSSDA